MNFDDSYAHRFLTSLQRGSTALGIDLTEEQCRLCLRFTERVLVVNETMNLTRIVEPEAVAIKHFVDSLTVFRAVPQIPTGARVVDVGTGAGFPGMVLKIVRPDIDLVLMDSLAKRLHFLRDTVDLLEMSGITTAHYRAEDAGRDNRHRDHYDLVVARAVAALPTLLEWCGPLVAPGGRFVAMKGASGQEEFDQVGDVPFKLGLRPTKPVALTLQALEGEADMAQRCLLIYDKVRPTPPRYPRTSAEIKRTPL